MVYMVKQTTFHHAPKVVVSGTAMSAPRFRPIMYHNYVTFKVGSFNTRSADKTFNYNLNIEYNFFSNDISTGPSMEKCSVNQCYTPSTLKNLVCRWWWALQHFVLQVTDNLYALTPNESLNKLTHRLSHLPTHMPLSRSRRFVR